MGGFQKYPIPRYLCVNHWVVNRNWRWNSFHMGVPIFLLCFCIWRHTMLTTYRPPNYGEYIDPASSDAPKKLKF